MSLITLAFLVVIIFALLGIIKRNQNLKDKISIAGNLALALGALGTTIGWFEAAKVMEVTSASASIIAGGLKVSLVTLMYGLLVYCISRIIRLFW